MDIVQANFLNIEEEGKYSIDEQMVPFKGKKAGSRKQYIKSKPHKLGIKVFVRSGISGIIYDFIIYAGEKTFRQIPFSLVEEQ